MGIAEAPLCNLGCCALAPEPSWVKKHPSYEELRSYLTPMSDAHACRARQHGGAHDSVSARHRARNSCRIGGGSVGPSSRSTSRSRPCARPYLASKAPVTTVPALILVFTWHAFPSFRFAVCTCPIYPWGQPIAHGSSCQ
jgi:hypothetical protein